MKITTQSQYSLLVLLYLARSKEDSYIPLSKIAQKQKLSLKYLEHLMQPMCRAGILASAKGQKGGYKLAHKPEKISIAEIIRLFDGPLAPVESVSVYFYKPTVIEREKKLSHLMRGIRNHIAFKLEKTTLKDLA